MTDTICVLVVGDHAVERKGLISLLRMSRSMSVVGEAANGEEALALVRVAHPQVMLLDQRILQREGPGSVWRVWREDVALAVLVIGSGDGLSQAVAELDGGKVVFIDKGAPVEDLVRTIRVVTNNHAGWSVSA